MLFYFSYTSRGTSAGMQLHGTTRSEELPYIDYQGTTATLVSIENNVAVVERTAAKKAERRLEVTSDGIHRIRTRNGSR